MKSTASEPGLSFFNYVINIPNVFIVFQLQSMDKFLMYNTNIFVHLQIYHDKAPRETWSNMAYLKLSFVRLLTSVHRLHNVKTKLIIWSSYQQHERFFPVKTETSVYYTMKGICLSWSKSTKFSFPPLSRTRIYCSRFLSEYCCI